MRIEILRSVESEPLRVQFSLNAASQPNEPYRLPPLQVAAPASTPIIANQLKRRSLHTLQRRTRHTFTNNYQTRTNTTTNSFRVSRQEERQPRYTI